MADLPFDSVELEAHTHPYYDHYTLSGNKGSKTIVVITPSEKNNLLTPKNRQGLHNEPKAKKGGVVPGLQKEPKTPK